MEQITLGDLAAWAGFIVALGGSVAAIVNGVKKALKAMFDQQMQAINARMDKQEEAISRTDMENCKNFLVPFLAECERGQEHDQIELERFHEQFSHYTKIGGNSYIAAKVEKLQKDGKL